MIKVYIKSRMGASWPCKHSRVFSQSQGPHLTGDYPRTLFSRRRLPDIELRSVAWYKEARFGVRQLGDSQRCPLPAVQVWAICFSLSLVPLGAKLEEKTAA